MHLIRNVPIERKLTLFAMLTSGAALTLACLAFLTYETVVFRGEMVGDLSTTAAMVADNSAAALTFNDSVSAAQTLKSLSAHPHIVGAAVYDAQGAVFATYRRTGSEQSFSPPTLGADGHRFDDDSLALFHGITLAGERTGTVYIRSDLEEMHARLWRYALIVASVMGAASLLAFFLSSRLRASISGPIFHLAGVVNAVAKQKDYSVRALKEEENELGELIDGFNDMLGEIQQRDRALQTAHDTLEVRVAQRTEALRKEIREREQAQAALERVHKQLLDASRRAGMAEVATNVLHNVGNVLNSVNVSAHLAAEQTRRSKVTDLAKVVALLREHQDDMGAFITADPRGRHLPDYLAHLSEHLLAERGETVKELDSLRSNIEHIKEIVTLQQNYAKVCGVKEAVNVVDLVEDSLRMDASDLDRQGVKIIREFMDNPRITIDKHKLLQILVNLVRNAGHACAESSIADKQLTLRVASTAKRVCISIIDNGIGIAPQNLTRIFSYGFTTRKDGHGFGLHGSALAARELGGLLRAHSEGIGRGAEFTLELPLEVSRMSGQLPGDPADGALSGLRTSSSIR